jgi:hypothetical protein
LATIKNSSFSSVEGGLAIVEPKISNLAGNGIFYPELSIDHLVSPFFGKSFDNVSFFTFRDGE